MATGRALWRNWRKEAYREKRWRILEIRPEGGRPRREGSWRQGWW